MALHGGRWTSETDRGRYRGKGAAQALHLPGNPSCVLPLTSRGEAGPGRWDQVQLDSLSFLLHRLLDDAMSGKYLHDNFTLPCPPGLRIPEEVGYTITPNTLKVLELSLTLEVGGWGV